MILDTIQKARACGHALIDAVAQMQAYAQTFDHPNVDVTISFKNDRPAFSSSYIDSMERLYSAHQKLEALAARPSFDAFPTFYKAALEHPVLGPIIARDPNKHLSITYRRGQCTLDIGFLRASSGQPPFLDPATLSHHLSRLTSCEPAPLEYLSITDERTSSYIGTGHISRATLDALAPFLLRDNAGPYGFWTPITDVQHARGKTALIWSNKKESMRMEMPEDDKEFASKSQLLNVLQQVPDSGTWVISIPAAGNKEGYPKKGL